MSTIRLPPTYWMTRDRRDGVLIDLVEIWAVRPEPLRSEDGDVWWVAPLRVERSLARISVMTLDEARREVYSGVPEDERQCVRVGPDPIDDPSLDA